MIKVNLVFVIANLVLILFTTSCMISTRLGAYDDTPPTVPTILNNSDFSFKSHYGMDTTPELSWDESIDQGLGINHYEVSIGTEENIEIGMRWTDVGKVNRVSFSGNKLERSKLYRFYLRAVDKGGNYSEIVKSEPWMSEPLVKSYSVKPVGLNLNSIIKNRMLASDGSDILFGSFNRRAVTNMGCFSRTSSIGLLDTQFGAHRTISCSGSVRMMRAQVLNSENYVVMVGGISQVGAVTVAAGQLVRFKLSGEFDSVFNANLGTGFTGSISDVTILPDNKILVVGDFTAFNGNAVGRIVRLNTDGTLDSSFDVGTGFDAIINSSSAFTNGKVVLGGKFTKRNGITISRFITVLNTDGSVDSTFVAGTGFNYIDTVSNVSSVRVTASGQILATGRFTSYNGTSSIICAALINANGTLDSNFSTKVANKFFSVNIAKGFVLSDGNYVFTGSVNQYNGQTVNGIFKASATTGNIDMTFRSNTNADISADSVTDAFVTGNKLVIVGYFSKVNNNTAYANIARLNLDGTVDPTFVYSSTSGYSSYPMAVMQGADGNYYFGGSFSFYGGIPTIGLLRKSPSSGVDVEFNTNAAASFNLALVMRTELVGDRIIAYGTTAANNRCFNLNGTSCTLTTAESKVNYNDTRLPDGSYILKGPITIDGVTIPIIGKVKADGTLDGSFNAITASYSTSGGSFSVKVVKEKIYVVGTFTGINGRSVGSIFRFNMDGTEDLGFVNKIGAGFSSVGGSLAVQSVTVDSRGYIYLGIYSIATNVYYKGASFDRLLRYVRLTPDLDYDTNFASVTTGITSTMPLGGFKLMPDDRIFMYGSLSLGAVKRSLVRLDKDGNFDTTFDQMTELYNISVSGLDFDDQDNLYIYGSGQPVFKGDKKTESHYLVLEANK